MNTDINSPRYQRVDEQARIHGKGKHEEGQTELVLAPSADPYPDIEVRLNWPNQPHKHPDPETDFIELMFSIKVQRNIITVVTLIIFVTVQSRII